MTTFTQQAHKNTSVHKNSRMKEFYVQILRSIIESHS